MILKNWTLAAVVAYAPFAAQADALLAFAVADDLSRFVYAEAPVLGDGTPAHGNTIIAQGYIYPVDTRDGGVEGTLANGDPVFSEFVIGEWRCNGCSVADGMRTETGAMAITLQVYRFSDGDLLISHSTELADPGVSIADAVTG